MEQLISQLFSPDEAARLAALRALIAEENAGKRRAPDCGGLVNNHIHTIYSFSPYSPTAAVWYARAAGLATAGIMDHDSVGGIKEFLTAAEIASFPVTCGFEVRIDMSDSPFAGRINNPDQDAVAYVACHGIPRNKTAECEAFLAPFREKRVKRDRLMTDRLNAILAPAGVQVDFDKDILPISMAAEGGSITERHLLFAVSKKLTARFGKSGELLPFLEQSLGLPVSDKARAQLTDPENPHFEYDLLGLLKGNLVSKFYIPATDELPKSAEFIAFCRSIGAIPAYAYLGDVGDSVTGDKRAQKFEDDFLPELFDYLDKIGFCAVTYMPSRNTDKQLARVMALCEKHNFFQISGEDINTPRQSFICPALAKPECAHLQTAAWALIGHELAATADPTDAIYGEKAASAFPDMAQRAEEYAKSVQ